MWNCFCTKFRCSKPFMRLIEPEELTSLVTLRCQWMAIRHKGDTVTPWRMHDLVCYANKWYCWVNFYCDCWLWLLLLIITFMFSKNTFFCLSKDCASVLDIQRNRTMLSEHFDDIVLSDCFLKWVGYWWLWLPYFPDLFNSCNYFLWGLVEDSFQK